MIGIDTNILVRFLTRDEEAQAQRAAVILTQQCSAESPGFISTVVLVELVWVLRSGYGYQREEIVRGLDLLTHAEELLFEHPDAVQRARRLYADGEADFPDALLGGIAAAHGCRTTLTFDTRAARTGLFELA